MTSLQDTIREFMRLGSQHVENEINFSSFPTRLRARLVREEAHEFEDACLALLRARNLEEREEAEAAIIDATCDIIWVAVGSAVAAGVDLMPFLDEVARANLSKVDGSLGPIVLSPEGKILKPPGFKPPDMLRLLRRLKLDQTLDRVHPTDAGYSEADDPEEP